MIEIVDSPPSNETPNPTSSTNRILHLDIFRGFAILGIFMVNFLVMNESFLFRDTWLMECSDIFSSTGKLNEVAHWLLETFFFSKFFPIFSFLFGIGVALQIRSLKEKKKSSTLFLFRRFTALFIFGILHILFIWSGDILHLYALFGFILICMYRANTTVIWLTALVLFAFPYFDEIYLFVCDFFSTDPQQYLANLSRSQIADIKVNGSLPADMQLRYFEYIFFTDVIVQFVIPVALPMALLGLYVVKKGIIDRIDSFVNKIRLPFLILFILIVTYRFVFRYWAWEVFDIEHGSLLSFFLWSIYIISEIMLSFSYLIVIVLLLRTNLGRKLLSPLQYVGRMAFTNYILQSVIGYLIMQTFGYYESFDVLGCILVVLVVFACQIPLSWLWLKYFKFGPLEWLWRCISYWKVLTIRKVERSNH
ncbi:MAG: DUF418 domain-containing protein [Crocinitomicaceae bacterium]